eukprot:TRINITY_DN17337_c0_g1_i1.p1 TRINITY_DN17337_c0_g1~~TRINITY_DN17337_c0_g1_i1.p1  ORF type:complete len:737 (+),score=232.86 TRINITY_DN17337_c0_g1_i1:34-2211(+)
MRKAKRASTKTQKSFGEVLAGETDDDVSSWVKKSRELEKNIKEKPKPREVKQKEINLAKQREQLLNDQDEKISYTQDDLSGLTVTHDPKQLEMGQTLILTLKDSKILKDNDVSEEPDELESINLRELERAKKNNDLRKKKPVYSAVDEFNADKKDLLPQYNEEAPDPSFTLGKGEGPPAPSKEEVLDAIRRKLRKHDDKAASETNGRVAYNLSTTSTLASEYYTHEELVEFRKASGKQKKLRKKKKEKIADLLPETSAEKSMDHGSRTESKKLKEDVKREAQKKEKRDLGYNRAIEKAVEKSSSLRDEKDVEMEDVDENILMNLHSEHFQKKKADILVAESVAASVEERRNEEDRQKHQKDSTIVFTSTSEFCRRLAPTPSLDSGVLGSDSSTKPKPPSLSVSESEAVSLSESGPELTADPSASAETEMQVDEEPEDEDNYELELTVKQQLLKQQQNNVSAPSSSSAPNPQVQSQGGFWVEESPGKTPSSVDGTENGGEESDEDGDGNGVLEEEPLVSRGLAATIKFLQQKTTKTSQSGLFRDPLETYGGRKNDKPLLFAEGEDPSPNIHLEHRDEFGRIMTPKESFRILSHRFHGKVPGKNKQEKKLRQYQEDLKRKQMSSTDTPLMTVRALQIKQQQLKSPYIILSGGSQTFSSSSSGISNSRTSGTESTNHFKEIKDEDLTKPVPFNSSKKVEFGITSNKRKSSSVIHQGGTKKINTAKAAK